MFQPSGARRHHGSMGTSHVPSRGRYTSSLDNAVVRASALRWVPYATAVSAVRGLLGASHEDLALRMPMLTRALRGTFFSDVAGEQPMVPPFSATSRFPEQELFFCADFWPMSGKALQDVNQAMMQVAVKAAAEEACVCYYNSVSKLLRLLVEENVHSRGYVVINRAAFESKFHLQWTPL